MYKEEQPQRQITAGEPQMGQVPWRSGAGGGAGRGEELFSSFSNTLASQRGNRPERVPSFPHDHTTT